MLYDAYKARILKIAQIFDYIRRHALVISGTVTLLIATVVTLFATKGLVGQVKGPTEITYGQSYTAKVRAFLGSAHLEYRTEGGEWSTEVPIYPGTYTVRGVSTSSAGNPRYGKESTFTISKKTIDVITADSEIEYGWLPKIQEKGLVYGDILRCDGFAFEDPASAVTNITPITESITVYTKDGRDVTDAYILHPVTTVITRTPRPISVTVQEAVHGYDGQPFVYEIYEQGGETLAEGDILQAKFTATLTDVGRVTNVPSLQVLNGSGMDVTHLYAITEQFGDLVVEKRPLVIQTGSGEFVYDGTEKSVTAFEPDAGTPLVEGHRIELTAAVACQNAGSYQNTLAFRVLDAAGRNVTSNYAITTVNGTVTVSRRPLKFTSADGEWCYDAQTHSAPFVAAIEGIADGQSYSVSAYKEIRNAGQAENLMSIEITADGKTVTGNYAITATFGTLTVTKRPIAIQTSSSSWIYSDFAYSDPRFVICSELGVLPSHRISLISPATITDVGEVVNTTGGVKILELNVNVTANYEITEYYGTLTIQPRPLALQAVNETVHYDGQPHGDGFKVAGFSMPLVKNHEISCTVSGIRTEVGTSTLQMKEVQILKDGTDKTANYQITTEPGEVTVLPRPVRVVLTPAEKEYDGTPLTSREVTAEAVPPLEFGLVLGHRAVNVKAVGSQTEIGRSKNTLISCEIEDHEGKNVTHNYALKLADGTLTVIPRKITLVSGSAQKEYDGEPLTCKDPIEITEGTLLEGHTLQMEATGSITEIGSVKNTIEGVILDHFGNNAMHLYEIRYRPGVLRITQGAHDSVGGILDESGKLTGGGGSNDGGETVIMMVRSEKSGEVYFRLKSFGNFTGQDWTEAPEYDRLLDGTYSFNYLTGTVLQNAGIENYRIEVKSYTSQYMLPYHPTQGTDADYTVQTSDVKYAGMAVDGQYSLQYYWYNGYGGELVGMMPEAYAAEELQYRKFVHEQYLHVDAETREFLADIIREKGFSASDPDVIEKVAHYIQNAATYNLKYSAEVDKATNAVIAFLSTYREGVCRHYATSAAMLYRTLGIPARYVIGYAGETVAGQWNKITTPGHAWVEVYIDGVGWIPVEVTGGGFELGGNADHKEELVIKPTYQSKVFDGTPLIAEHTIEITPKLAELLKKGYRFTVEVSGTLTAPGVGISRVKSFNLIDPQGKNATNEYHVLYEAGVLEMFSRSTDIIRVYLYRLHKYYDGTPLTFAKDDFEILEMADDIRLELDLNISLTNAGYLTLGDLNAAIDHYIIYRVYRLSDGKDVTDSYRIIFDVFDSTPADYLPIHIDPRPLDLTANSVTKEYDGEPLRSNGVTVTFGSLLSGHHIARAHIPDFITEVGTEACHIDPDSIVILDAAGNDVTDNYKITTKPGTLTLEPPKEK